MTGKYTPKQNGSMYLALFKVEPNIYKLKCMLLIHTCIKTLEETEDLFHRKKDIILF